jgi:xanthine dehydrogenase iron-sulfur cluster and FAD-binding subunit A
VWPSTYHAPESLAELHDLLTRYGADARMFMGGTDVIVRLRHGDMRPDALIDLKRVDELSGQIAQHDRVIRIGARVTMTTLLGDARIRRWFPALLEAAAVVGSVQIRNRATLVGNVCNASPAADTVPVLLVHDAVANIAGPSGERRVPLSGFFVGPGRTVLQQGELVASLDVPIPAGSAGAAFGRLTRRRGVDLAIINLCVLLEAGRPARLAFGAVAPTPILGLDATGALDGTREWTDAADEALASMLMSTRPISDVRGGRDYRAAMLPVLSKRAWRTARERLASASAHVAETGEGFVASGPASARPEAAQRRSGVGQGGPASDAVRGFRETKFPGLESYHLRVNGQDRDVSAPAHHTLLDVLRDELRLTGTKECCAEGECGACTVHVDSDAVCSCLVLAAEMPGHEITTIEGLASDGRLDPLQAAFVECGAVQCGFCIPGMIVSARALLNGNLRPTREEVQDALSGNLCRCGGYSRIVDAVLRVGAPS